jgi:hypothetical protein
MVQVKRMRMLARYPSVKHRSSWLCISSYLKFVRNPSDPKLNEMMGGTIR